jgi:transcription antitermination factor NusG
MTVRTVGRVIPENDDNRHPVRSKYDKKEERQAEGPQCRLFGLRKCVDRGLSQAQLQQRVDIVSGKMADVEAKVKKIRPTRNVLEHDVSAAKLAHKRPPPPRASTVTRYCGKQFALFLT